MPSFPARLHVLSAQNAPVSVIVRRGPSKQVCTILWNRQSDTFSVGQWLKGRIYERRSDISPDGKYLIYFAMSFRWASEGTGSWTAISKVPWLKAIAFFAEVGTYEGGGLFTGNQTYWSNERYGHKELRNTDEVKRDTSFHPEISGYGADTSVYYPRLLRDGWMLKNGEERGERDRVRIFDKPLPNGWTLRKIAHEQVFSPPGKGCYWDEHELVNESSEQVIHKPDWEWADLDQETLVWAEKGALFRAAINGTIGLNTPQLLRDFTDMSFEAIEAPY